MSENEDDSQKTEDPTQKRIEESRKKGQVPLSREVNNWLILLTGTLLISGMGYSFFKQVYDLLEQYVANAHAMPTGTGGLTIALGYGTFEVVKILFLPFLALIATAIAGPFLQIGPLFAPEAIQPKLEKISIIKGFSRLFSMRSFMEFAKGIFKIAVVSVVGVVILYPYFDKLEHLIEMPMMMVMDELQGLIVRLMIGILIVLVIIAVADLVYQRYEHLKKMRMSRQEIKDEFKQTEGDPHVRARLRQLRQQKSQQRMMQNVPDADVVITNPTHFSIALKYDPQTMEAPMCVAKGIDEIALRIREVAKEHDVIIYENVPLARSLYDVVDIDQTIPAEQYQAVAEVISFVFKQRGERIR
ncbi:MAG: flagellar biosynthesis protein FlhB [Micavibrio sp. TMED27]|nr:flagellar biosynthesis protein FlhB [Micavibrio sp.]OUT89673.1 MAG: flagellar biosynthesis protein FlhB [Micavibrio sp. TMED27]|tara:strand:+ start:658 stop:1731 length:1074 start_codon:yes stop_codon:yes gene_type:complete